MSSKTAISGRATRELLEQPPDRPNAAAVPRDRFGEADRLAHPLDDQTGVTGGRDQCADLRQRRLRRSSPFSAAACEITFLIGKT